MKDKIVRFFNDKPREAALLMVGVQSVIVFTLGYKVGAGRVQSVHIQLLTNAADSTDQVLRVSLNNGLAANFGVEGLKAALNK